MLGFMCQLLVASAQGLNYLRDQRGKCVSAPSLPQRPLYFMNIEKNRPPSSP
jgi:hypothetical protein